MLQDGVKDTSSPPSAGAADETCGEGDEALELACEETMLPGSPVMADTAAGSAPSAGLATYAIIFCLIFVKKTPLICLRVKSLNPHNGDNGVLPLPFLTTPATQYVSVSYP